MAGGHARERTALIVTVLNEAGTVDQLLESIALQTVAPDEVVIADGGSTDATLQKLEAWSARLPLTIVRANGANISRGRNLAISASQAELIAVTDAGVRLAADWLEQLELAMAPDVDVVSGFFRPDPQTVFERSLGATTLPDVTDVAPDRFLPSSRSILFRRAVWQKAGGYPEWLDYCEDLLFDLTAWRQGCNFVFEPSAVAWFRPRDSLRAFFKQYFVYARGDGKAGLYARRHAIRYAAYFVSLLLLTRWRRFAWLLPAGLFAYTRRPYQRLMLEGLTLPRRALAVAWVPLIRAVGDVAKMLGYPVGVSWRAGRLWRRRWTSRSSS